MPGRNYSQDAEKYANSLGMDRKAPAAVRGKKITPIEVVRGREKSTRDKPKLAKMTMNPMRIEGKRPTAYDIIRKKGGDTLPPTMDSLMSEMKRGR